MDYDKLLDRVYSSLPKKSKEDERFELPVPQSLVQGQKTLIKNFSALAKELHRDEKHIFKFITKEFATAATIDGSKLVLNGKFSPDQIQKMFDSYTKEYVLCHVCGKPETKIVDEQGVKMLKCQACGALSSIRRI